MRDFPFRLAVLAVFVPLLAVLLFAKPSFGDTVPLAEFEALQVKMGVLAKQNDAFDERLNQLEADLDILAIGVADVAAASTDLLTYLTGLRQLIDELESVAPCEPTVDALC